MAGLVQQTVRRHQVAFLKQKRKRHQAAFLTQFAIVNMNSGNVITFHDDGCMQDGSPNQQRTAALRKAKMRDEDGDPIFILPDNEVPEFILEWDRGGTRSDGAGGYKHFEPAQDPLSILLMRPRDPSRSDKYKTLGEKLEARKAEYAREQRRVSAILQHGGAQLPPGVQALADALVQAQAGAVPAASQGLVAQASAAAAASTAAEPAASDATEAAPAATAPTEPSPRSKKGRPDG